ncbi:MAG: transcriptional repressor, partial [Gammaproteobacteria bacterium]|nr:transcriptional repressor [Gammaproteobacteria bacterium]
GIIIRHNFEGGCSVFELNDEGHHDHMVCAECGEVFEFFDEVIEQRQRAVAESAGFVIDEHSLHMYGVCIGMRLRGKCSMEEHKKTGIIGTDERVKSASS